MTKKILFGILTFLGIGLSFCSAGEFTVNGTYTNNGTSLYAGTTFCGIQSHFDTNSSFDYSCSFSNFSGTLNSSDSVKFVLYYNYLGGNMQSEFIKSDLSSDIFTNNGFFSGTFTKSTRIPIYFSFRLGVSNSTPFSFDYSCTFSGAGISDSSNSCSASSIDVIYNNHNSVQSVVCDGDNSIWIDGLATMTNTTQFTPYFNINYRDQDNQLLTESYDKSLLILSGGNFKKTYTGNNEWILNLQESSNNNEFTGYLPTFDVEFTGDIIDTGNIFNNFAENSLKFTLSNIPNYIQYVIIIMLLFFILGFIRKFRRK